VITSLQYTSVQYFDLGPKGAFLYSLLQLPTLGSYIYCYTLKYTSEACKYRNVVTVFAGAFSRTISNIEIQEHFTLCIHYLLVYLLM